MSDFIEERGTGTSRAVKILQRQLCLGQSQVYMFVHKISINEESLIVYNYEKDQPQWLLSFRIFLGMDSCTKYCNRESGS